MKRHPFTLTLGMIMIIFIAAKLVIFTGIFDPNDKSAEHYRWDLHMEETIEGSFLDKDGEVIFAPIAPYTKDKTPIPVEFSYLLGYNKGYNHEKNFYNITGLRRQYNDHLYNDQKTGIGGSIQLTIDNVLQKKAYAILQDNHLSGSVIVMDAKNAEILAMAGRRGIDYDLNDNSSETWAKYNSTEGFFVFPPTGDYQAPGSTFKILTSAAAIINGLEGYTYYDDGSLEIDGHQPITNANSGRYGNETLATAFIHSTNTYFGSLSMDVGERAMTEIYKSFLVGEQIDLGFARLKSTANFDGSEHNLALMGFGQGGVAVAPLHIAMVGQSIINDGVMLKPTLIKGMYDTKNVSVFQNNQHEMLSQTVSPEVAEKVRALMEGVTQNDDNKRRERKLPLWTETYTPHIYIKTGTAQPKDSAEIYNSYLLCMTDDYVILISINNTPASGSDLKPYAEKFLKELY